MMSSIGALCGSETCHSSPPPKGVCFCMHACCWCSHPVAQAIAVCSSMRQKISQRRLTHKHKEASASSSYGYATLALKNSTMGSSKKNLSSPSNTLTHTTGLCSLIWRAHTIPLTIAWYKNPLPLTVLLQGETFPRRGKKHLVVISLTFFTPLFPSAPFH